MHNYGAGSTRSPYQGYPYINPSVTEIPSNDAATSNSTIQNYGTGSSRIPYQGYPYVNPTVTDVPTIDAATASKYSHLPRSQGGVRSERDRIFIDIPSSNGSSVSQPNKTRPEIPKTSKADPDENPVVYIDLPESSGSDVADKRPANNGEESFVQDTIFYDQFKDRRIEIDRSDSEGSSAHSSTKSTYRPRPDLLRRPPPPNTLNLVSPDRGYASSNFAQSLPSIISKEAAIYGPYATDDGFNLQQLQVRDFPKPPPAYSEVDRSPQSVGNSGSPQVTLTPSSLHEDIPLQELSTPEPPRTQVIVPPETGLTGNADNKIMITCPYCGTRTHSLIVRQSGLITHLIAFLFFMVGLFPVSVLVYCTSTCKYINHYCKNCSKLVAFEIPVVCQDLTYVKT